MWFIRVSKIKFHLIFSKEYLLQIEVQLKPVKVLFNKSHCGISPKNYDLKIILEFFKNKIKNKIIREIRNYTITCMKVFFLKKMVNEFYKV